MKVTHSRMKQVNHITKKPYSFLYVFTGVTLSTNLIRYEKWNNHCKSKALQWHITIYVDWFFQLVTGWLEPSLKVLYLVNNHRNIELRVSTQLTIACCRRTGPCRIRQCSVFHVQLQPTSPVHNWPPLTSTWPHLNSDVRLEEGEY